MILYLNADAGNTHCHATTNYSNCIIETSATNAFCFTYQSTVLQNQSKSTALQLDMGKDVIRYNDMLLRQVKIATKSCIKETAFTVPKGKRPSIFLVVTLYFLILQRPFAGIDATVDDKITVELLQDDLSLCRALSRAKVKIQ